MKSESTLGDTAIDALATIIREVRHPKWPDDYVPSEVIAAEIIKNGYSKVEDHILVTGRMIDAALKAANEGIFELRELENLDLEKSRMKKALYAAFGAWRSIKFLTSKDHAERS